jgi:hypothetical protein
LVVDRLRLPPSLYCFYTVKFADNHVLSSGVSDFAIPQKTIAADKTQKTKQLANLSLKRCFIDKLDCCESLNLLIGTKTRGSQQIFGHLSLILKNNHLNYGAICQ